MEAPATGCSGPHNVKSWQGEVKGEPDLTAEAAPAPGRRWAGWDWQLYQLGSAPGKTVGSFVAKAEHVHSGDEVLPLGFSPWGKNPCKGIPRGTKLHWTRGWGDTGNMLPTLFCGNSLIFWASQDFCCFFVVQSFPKANHAGSKLFIYCFLLFLFGRWALGPPGQPSCWCHPPLMV